MRLFFSYISCPPPRFLRNNFNRLFSSFISKFNSAIGNDIAFVGTEAIIFQTDSANIVTDGDTGGTDIGKIGSDSGFIRSYSANIGTDNGNSGPDIFCKKFKFK